MTAKQTPLPEAGLYELTEDVANPKPDRRTRNEWAEAEFFPKGARVAVTYRTRTHEALEHTFDVQEIEVHMVAGNPDGTGSISCSVVRGALADSDGWNGKRIATIMGHLAPVAIKTVEDAMDLTRRRSMGRSTELILHHLVKTHRISVADATAVLIADADGSLYDLYPEDETD